MARCLVLVCGLLLLIALTVGCQQGVAKQVTLGELFSNSGKYSGKYIITEGFYFHGFGANILSESLEYSGYAEGHVVPEGRMLFLLLTF